MRMQREIDVDVYALPDKEKTKLLVISDSHGDIENLRSVVAREADADVLVHLGDHFSDIQSVSVPQHTTVCHVRGNCDMGGAVPEEMLLCCAKAKLFLCHGHRYHVKSSLDLLLQRGKDLGADAVLFGHTHVPVNDCSAGILCLNPGALNRYRCFIQPTYLVLFVDEQGRVACQEKTL